MKLPREPKPIAMVPDVLGRERERLLQLESEKADLLKRIQVNNNFLLYFESKLFLTQVFHLIFNIIVP